MCHGHPKFHPCEHSSVNWHWCPAALIDLETGCETPCSNVSFAAVQDSKLDCPLQSCKFGSKGPIWRCCVCKRGPNTKGWCVQPVYRNMFNHETLQLEVVESTCDHGCCSTCKKITRGRERTTPTTPSMDNSKIRKGSASREFGYGSASGSHRHDSALSMTAGYPPVLENASPTSTSTSTPRSNSGSSAGHGFDFDYSGNQSNSGQKRHKSRR